MASLALVLAKARAAKTRAENEAADREVERMSPEERIAYFTWCRANGCADVADHYEGKK